MLIYVCTVIGGIKVVKKYTENIPSEFIISSNKEGRLFRGHVRGIKSQLFSDIM